MNDAIQASITIVLAAIVVGLLVYYILAQRQSGKSGKELDESYRSFDAALEQLVNAAEPVERQQSTPADERDRPRPQQNVEETVVRHRSREEWPLVAQIGTASIAFGASPPRWNTDLLVVCPVCNNIFTGMDLVNPVTRERFGSHSGYMAVRCQGRLRRPASR